MYTGSAFEKHVHKSDPIYVENMKVVILMQTVLNSIQKENKEVEFICAVS